MPNTIRAKIRVRELRKLAGEKMLAELRDAGIPDGPTVFGWKIRLDDLERVDRLLNRESPPSPRWTDEDVGREPHDQVVAKMCAALEAPNFLAQDPRLWSQQVDRWEGQLDRLKMAVGLLGRAEPTALEVANEMVRRLTDGSDEE